MANIAGRLDRLPMSAFHVRIVFCLAFLFFFELGDLNAFSYAAPALITSMGLTVDDIARVSSGSFLGIGPGPRNTRLQFLWRSGRFDAPLMRQPQDRRSDRRRRNQNPRL